VSRGWISQDTLNDFSRRIAQAGRSQNGPGWQPSDTPAGTPLRGILLDDLTSDETAPLAVTELVLDGRTHSLSLFGNAEQGFFRLRVPTVINGQLQRVATAEISPLATARELQEKINDTVGAGWLNVTLGGTVTFEAPRDPGRPWPLPERLRQQTTRPAQWLLTYTDSAAQSLGVASRDANGFLPLVEPVVRDTVGARTLGGLSLLVARPARWERTGELVTVRAILPVGQPTPLRRGAVAVALAFPDPVGWGVIAVEPRPWPGLSGYGAPFDQEQLP
jgi:hypothetical protein